MPAFVVQASREDLMLMSLAENLAHAALWAFGVFFVGVAMFVSKKHKFADLV